MPNRRAFLAASTAALMRAAQKPKLFIVRGEFPYDLAANGVTFRRAYSACPDGQPPPFLTGIFPHAYGVKTPAVLTDRFELVNGPGDDTIALYTIASGDSSASAFEQSVHVPLVIGYSAKLPRAVTDVLISSVDVMPTILALAGLPPADTQGRDLSEFLVTGSGPTPASIYAEGRLGRPGEWRMIVRGFDKLITNARLEPLHLFNLSSDPREEQDLAREPGHTLRIDELRALMLDWRRRTNDGMDASGLKRRR
jgi:arylsulfatase A-like enzyme